MTFLPIVERELRVASRRRSTYFGRIGGAVVAIGIGGWVMMTMHGQPPGMLGGALFVTLSILLFFYSLFSGAKITADCLSEEKREGTLGLLFLTDLKGYDIVSGKLVANSINTFYGLLSAFPVLAISLLMGGVTSTEFWRVSLVATNLLFLSLATGMFASALCREERRALSIAFLLLFIVLAGGPIIEFCLHLANDNRQTNRAFFLPSPAFACFSAFGTKLGFTSREFWIPVALTQLYGWVFLGLASVIAPRSWQDKAARTPFQFRQLRQRISRTDASTENRRRTDLLSKNPFLWLAARDGSKTVYLWIILAALSALWFWAYLRWPSDWLSIPTYIITAIILHTILKFWVASEACSRFVQDRKSGALELLLSTPLSVEEILRGQKMALFRQFAGPVLFVLAVDSLFLFLGFHSHDMASSSDRRLWILLWLAGMSIFVLDLFAISWVSMWMGLNQLKINRASGGALSRILVVPWAVFVFSLTLVGTLSLFSFFHFDAEAFILYWFAIACFNSVLFMNWAKNNLHKRFREIATQRFDKKSAKKLFKTSANATENPELPPIIHSN